MWYSFGKEDIKLFHGLRSGKFEDLYTYPESISSGLQCYELTKGCRPLPLMLASPLTTAVYPSSGHCKCAPMQKQQWILNYVHFQDENIIPISIVFLIPQDKSCWHQAYLIKRSIIQFLQVFALPWLACNGSLFKSWTLYFRETLREGNWNQPPTFHIHFLDFAELYNLNYYK